MKKIMKFSKLLFLATVLIFTSCSEQDELLLLNENNTENVNLSKDDASFSARAVSKYLINFTDYTGRVQKFNFTARGDKRKLLGHREAIAYYRIYVRAYTYYLKRKKLDLSDINSMGYPVKYYLQGSGSSRALRAKNLITTVKAVYATNSKSEKWELISKHLKKMNKIGIASSGIIRGANKWDALTSNEGSYTIIFDNNKMYIGKGGGVSRMRQSAISWSKRRGTKGRSGEFQNASTSCFYRTYRSPYSNPLRRQAFKEEAIKMLFSGYKNSNLYNGVWSPGKKYITEDSF